MIVVVFVGDGGDFTCCSSGGDGGGDCTCGYICGGDGGGDCSCGCS